LLIPAVLGMAHLRATNFGNPLLSFLFIMSAWAGAILGTYFFDKKIIPQFSFRIWLRCVYGGWVMRFGIWGVLIAGGVLMPEEFGWPLVLLGSAVIAIQAGLHFGLWIWLVRITGMLVRTKGSEPLCDIVQRTSERMQIPYRAVWILRNPLGYAAALPTTRDLIFSEGLLASHPAEEIESICAHELAHLSEPRPHVFARVLGSMSLCPLIFIHPMVHAFDFGGVTLLLVPMIVFTVYVRRLGRRMEVRADAMANENAAERVFMRAPWSGCIG
jgi:Zn-dependent protease with chaperone function